MCAFVPCYGLRSKEMMSVLNVMSSIMMGRRAVLERKDLAEVGDCLAGMGPTFNDQLSVFHRRYMEIVQTPLDHEIKCLKDASDMVKMP